MMKGKEIKDKLLPVLLTVCMFMQSAAPVSVRAEEADTAEGTVGITEEAQEQKQPMLDIIELEENPVVLQESEISKVYGDSSFELSELVSKNGYDGSIRYSVKNGSSVTVSEDGHAAVKAAGGSIITVSAPETETYKGKELSITVNVAKKQLTIGTDDITVGEVTKVYDGKKTAPVEGEIKSSAGLVGEDRITFTGSAQAESAEVGVYDSSVLAILSYTGAENYSINADVTGPKMTIRKPEATVSVEINGIDDFGSYSGKTNYSIETSLDVEEGGKDAVTSVDVKVTSDGNVVNGENRENSFTVTGSDISSTINAAVTKAAEGDVTLTVTAEDMFGNKGTAVKHFLIDTTAPVITAAYDNNSAQNSRYFNGDRVLTINVKERWFYDYLLELDIDADGTRDRYSVQDIKDGKVPGVSLESKSQNGEDHTFRIRFGKAGEEHSYRVGIICDDEAGNIGNAAFADGTVAGSIFTVDRKAPTLDIVLSEDGEPFAASAEETAPRYGTKNAKIEITIDEKEFDRSDVVFSMAAEDAEGNAVDTGVTDPSGSAWRKNGTENIWTANITRDGRYTLSAEYTDLAGNKAKAYKESYFVIDKEAPKGSIKVIKEDGTEVDYGKVLEEKQSQSGLISYIYGMFENRYVKLANTATDKTSGVASFQYALVDAGKDSGHSFDIDMTKAKWKDYTEEVRIDTNKNFVVLEKIVDRAGHVTYLSSKGGIVTDFLAPKAPVIKIEGEKDGIYSGDITLKITAEEDEEEEGIYAGLRSLTYTVTNMETGSETMSETITSDTAREKQLTADIVISADENNANSVKLNVVAEDFAGNTSEKEKVFSLDSINPLIETAFDETGVVNEHYYPIEKEMELSVTERNLSAGDIKLLLKVNGEDKEYSIGSLIEGKGEEDGITAAFVSDSQQETDAAQRTDERKLVYTLLFGAGEAADFDYDEIRFTAVDGAGNETGEITAVVERITVDKVAPVMEMTILDGEEDITEKTLSEEEVCYTKDDVSVRFAVTETNFSTDQLEIGLTQKDGEGEDVAAYDADALPPAEEEWVLEEGVHTAVLPVFDKDANYEIEASFRDLAGNEAVKIEPHRFTVDHTAPEGSIIVTSGKRTETYRGFSETAVFNFITRQPIAIVNEASDATSGVDSVLYYRYVPGIETHGTFKALTLEDLKDKKFAPWNSELKVEPDAQAIIYAKITDKAGNVTYLSTEDAMVVDGTSPEKPVIAINSQHSGNGIFDSDIQLGISVKDARYGGTYAGLKTVKIEVLSDGEVTQEETYTFEDRTQRKNSFSTDFTIAADKNNSNDLILKVYAEDWAGNSVEERQAYSTDVTEPVISLSFDKANVKNGKYYNETKALTGSVTERNYNADDTKLTVKVNGTWHVFSMNDLKTGKAKECGITLRSLTDSQEGRPAKEHTDDRKISFVILFGDTNDADFAYEGLRFSTEDLAGNKAQDDSVEDFIIDKVAPIASISFMDGSNDVTAKVGTEKKAPYYTHGKVTASLTVEDTNFRAEDAEVEISQKNYAGKDLHVYNTALSGEWKKTGGNVNKNTLPVFSADANYGISLKYTDLAGNVAPPVDMRYFTIDNTEPEGSIHVASEDGSGVYRGYSETAVFTFVSSQPIVVTDTAEDETSGIASVLYYKHSPDLEARGTFRGLSLSELRNVNWEPWNSEIRVSPDSQAIVYARIADKAGNMIYLSTEGAMIADHTQPSAPEIDLRAKASARGIYRSDVPVSFSVSDAVRGGTYAGLKTVTVQVKKDGTVTQAQSYDVASKSQRQRSFSSSITVDAKKNNSNNVRVIVTAEDWAGNISSRELELKIDITAPRIEVSYDNNDAKNGRYYNRTRTATVRVYERNFIPSDANLRITSTSGKMPSVSSWSIGPHAGASDDNVNTCTITYDADSDYTFTMSVTDGAGNTTNLGHTDSFTVDKTAPVITVAYDPASGNGRYFNRNRTATITVTDHTFSPQAFTAAIQASLDGKGITAPSVSGWTSNGDTHRATITFSADGDYRYSLNATDLAGNKANTYTENGFTIDKTAPEIDFFNVKNNSANKGEVKPGVNVTDINFRTGSVKLTLKGQNHPEKVVTGEIRTLERGVDIILQDFKRTVEEDDVYTLTAEAYDMAGNRKVSRLTFSVNRFGSNYYFSEETKDFLDRKFNKEGVVLEIYEENVDSLKNNGITIAHDGTVVTLDKDQYTVEDLSKEGERKRYRYTINSDLFKEEGLYEITIDSSDEAGNRQDNKLKETPISFVIDRTPPSAVVTGIENGMSYNEANREVTINVADDNSISGLKVYINGQEAASYTAEDIRNANGKIIFKLPEDTAWQSISAIATDAAGNESEPEDIRVLVTTNGFVRFLNNTLLKGIIALLGGGGALLFFLLKRKKKEDEE